MTSFDDIALKGKCKLYLCTVVEKRNLENFEQLLSKTYKCTVYILRDSMKSKEKESGHHQKIPRSVNTVCVSKVRELDSNSDGKLLLNIVNVHAT